MHLIDDEHLVFALLRLEANLLDEGANMFDRVVGGGVQLRNVKRGILAEGLTGGALIAGLEIGGHVLAVEHLGEDARARGFAHTPRPAKQEGVRQLVVLKGVLEGAGHMLLPYYVFKADRPVLPGRYYEIAHQTTLI